MERIKKSDKARIKAIKDFVEEKSAFNVQYWDSVPRNNAEFEKDRTRRCKSIQDTWS